MKWPLLIRLTALLAAPVIHTLAAEPALMPQVADTTQMWWAEGFPSLTPTAPWLRVIQTGRYAMALNTETLRVEHRQGLHGVLPGERRGILRSANA